MAVKCDDWYFERSISCGHEKCQAARRAESVQLPQVPTVPEEPMASRKVLMGSNDSEDRLENLISFMKTCKTA